MIHAILNEIMKRFETNNLTKSASFKHQAYRLVLQAFFSSKILNTLSTVLQRLSDTKKLLGQLHLNSTLQHIATIPPSPLKTFLGFGSSVPFLEPDSLVMVATC